MEIILACSLVFLVFFLVPIVVYGLFAMLLGLKEPKKKAEFFGGVLVQKLATTLGFVLIFAMARQVFDDQWLLYAAVWFCMFALTELGQIAMGGYSKKEALAGVISEAVYAPLGAFLLHLVL